MGSADACRGTGRYRQHTASQRVRGLGSADAHFTLPAGWVNGASQRVRGLGSADARLVWLAAGWSTGCRSGSEGWDRLTLVVRTSDLVRLARSQRVRGLGSADAVRFVVRPVVDGVSQRVRGLGSADALSFNGTPVAGVRGRSGSEGWDRLTRLRRASGSTVLGGRSGSEGWDRLTRSGASGRHSGAGPSQRVRGLGSADARRAPSRRRRGWRVAAGQRVGIG